MPSYTASLRFVLQDTGSNLNVWGNVLNSGAIALIDTAIAGRYSTTASAVTLSSNQGTTDTARNAILDVTGGTGTVFTAPAVSKLYFVRNGSSGDVTVTTGGVTNAIVKAGERVPVVGDGTNFYRLRLLDMGGDQLSNLATPTTNNAAATKGYVDAIAFQNTGALPGQNPGTAYNAVFSDGVNAAWRRALPIGATAGQFLQSTGIEGFPETTSTWTWDGYQGRQVETSAFTFTNTRRGKLLLCTGTFTVGLDLAATLGQKAHARLVNVGTGLITIDPAGAETVTMAGQAAKAQIVLIPGEGVDLYGDGVSNWYGILASGAGAGPHLYASESSAPTYSATTWQTRLVSVLNKNLLGAVYSGGDLQNIPPGVYRAKFQIAGGGVDSFVGRIFNATAGSEIFHGEVGIATSFNPDTSAGGTTTGDDSFSLAVNSTLQLQSYGNNATGAGAWTTPGASPLNKATSIWLTRISP